MYYEERRSGRGFGRVLRAGTANGRDGSAGADALRQTLDIRVGAQVDAIDPRAAASMTGDAAGSPELLDRLAPLVGMLVREPAA